MDFKASIQAAKASIQAAWNKVPQPVKLVARDALEAAVAAVASLALTIPANIDDAQREATVVAFAAGAAIIAVLRRELLPWLVEKLFSSPSQGS